MKKIVLLLNFLSLLYLSTVAQNISNIEEYTLENGLRVILIPYGSLKTSSIALYVNCGKKNEIPGQQLFSSIAAECVTFGSIDYDKVQLSNELFKLGATLNVDANENYTSITASFIDADLAAGLKVMSSSVMEPLFPEVEIKQYIAQTLDYNNPMKMDILQQASLFSNYWVYGSQNPIGRYYQSEVLQKITPNDIREFYQFNYTPKNSRLVICGNFDKEKVKQLVKENFGKWKAAYGEVNGVSFESPQMKGKEYGFVNRTGAIQAGLQWNKNGPQPGSKDELTYLIAIEAFNTILFKEIREKGGKTYGISAQYDPSSGSAICAIVTQVRSDEMLNTCNLFDATIKNFYEQGISTKILKVARSNMRSRWLMIESPANIITFFNPIIYSKLASRKNYLTEVDAVTIEQVNKIIKKYFTPDSYKLMISGDELALNTQLSQLKPLRRFTLKDLENN